MKRKIYVFTYVVNNIRKIIRSYNLTELLVFYHMIKDKENYQMFEFGSFDL